MAEELVQLGTRLDEMDKRLSELRTDVNQRFGELRTDMSELRTDVNQRFGELRTDMNARFSQLTWMMGVWFTFLTLLMVLFKFI